MLCGVINTPNPMGIFRCPPGILRDLDSSRQLYSERGNLTLKSVDFNISANCEENILHRRRSCSMVDHWYWRLSVSVLVQEKQLASVDARELAWQVNAWKVKHSPGKQASLICRHLVMTKPTLLVTFNHPTLKEIPQIVVDAIYNLAHHKRNNRGLRVLTH